MASRQTRKVVVWAFLDKLESLQCQYQSPSFSCRRNGNAIICPSSCVHYGVSAGINRHEVRVLPAWSDWSCCQRWLNQWEPADVLGIVQALSYSNAPERKSCQKHDCEFITLRANLDWFMMSAEQPDAAPDLPWSAWGSRILPPNEILVGL